MSNMSYCMFQNTLKDFKDAVEHLEFHGAEELSNDELKAAYNLLRNAKDFVSGFEELLSDEHTHRFRTESVVSPERIERAAKRIYAQHEAKKRAQRNKR